MMKTIQVLGSGCANCQRTYDLIARTAATEDVQFIIVTHSPVLLSIPGASVYSFDRQPVGEVPYRETDQYRVYEQFFRERP